MQYHKLTDNGMANQGCPQVLQAYKLVHSLFSEVTPRESSHTETVKIRDNKVINLAWHGTYSRVRADCCAPGILLVKEDWLASWSWENIQPLWVSQSRQAAASNYFPLHYPLRVTVVEILMRSTLKSFLILVPSWRFSVRRQNEAFILSTDLLCQKNSQ